MIQPIENPDSPLPIGYRIVKIRYILIEIWRNQFIILDRWMSSRSLDWLSNRPNWNHSGRNTTNFSPRARDSKTPTKPAKPFKYPQTGENVATPTATPKGFRHLRALSCDPTWRAASRRFIIAQCIMYKLVARLSCAE